MSDAGTGFELARQVADAVLFEGYVLYPYRASSQKNHLRWQFGVLVPQRWSESGPAEPWSNQTEVLVEPKPDATLRLKLRFLQAQAKTVEAADEAGAMRPVPSLDVDGATHVTFDEGVDHEVDASLALDDVLAMERTIPFAISAGRAVEPLTRADGSLAGQLVRERWPIEGGLRVGAERLDGPYGVVKVRVAVENVTPWGEDSAGRDAALRRSLIAAHTLLLLERGTFISLLEPPEWARPAVATCENRHTWPVMIGEGRRDLILSSPIILYDYPTIAPESAGDLFDATEIDEILTLRTMALTDDEKREARGTDTRAAAIIDRVDTMPPEYLERLHGAIRDLRQVASVPPPHPEPPETPWWDPGVDSSVSPETDSVLIGDVAVQKGSRVRLRPGSRRADAQDMFLVGREARVEAVLFDVDDAAYLAVSLADNPNADLLGAHGRFLYFQPDEVEPLEGSG